MAGVLSEFSIYIVVGEKAKTEPYISEERKHPESF